MGLRIQFGGLVGSPQTLSFDQCAEKNGIYEPINHGSRNLRLIVTGYPLHRKYFEIDAVGGFIHDITDSTALRGLEFRPCAHSITLFSTVDND